jgi:hypothetical protein
MRRRKLSPSVRHCGAARTPTAIQPRDTVFRTSHPGRRTPDPKFHGCAAFDQWALLIDKGCPAETDIRSELAAAPEARDQYRHL